MVKKKKKRRRPKKIHYTRIPKKWSVWLKIIQNDIVHLLHLHNIYSEVKTIYSKNNRLRKHSDTFFYDYFRETYASTIAIGIRRVIDDNRKSLSALKLMWELHDNCHLLTRERYVHLYKNMDVRDRRRIANKHYDKLVGKGKGTLTKSVVRKDIAALINDSRVQRIRKHVNKCLAHRNIRPIKKNPTYNDLKKALGLVEYIVGRYSSILFAQGWIGMTPTIQGNWTAIFEEPWIEKRKIRR